ncbi:sugar transporter ERD6 [Trifolium repens]|nr:sugar transporter ERD6 [Trifolium repens]
MIQYLIFLRAQLIPKIVLGEGQIHRGWGCNRNGAVIIQKGCYSTQSLSSNRRTTVRFAELKQRRYWLPLMIGIGLLVLQQLSGINGVLF